MSSALEQSEPTFWLEFFPPKDQIGEDRLWNALTQLHSRHPDFVSVTFGGVVQRAIARLKSHLKLPKEPSASATTAIVKNLGLR